jgi:hypothetical protein
MASIALSVIGCIDYLAYGTIFTRAMFRPKKKVDVFFPARKAADEPWEVVNSRRGAETWGFHESPSHPNILLSGLERKN